MDKEVIKKFVKPGVAKIIITIIFFILSREGISNHGFPLPYLIPYATRYPDCPIGGPNGPFGCPSYLFEPKGLIIDILFWYFISSIIILIFNKLRGKHRTSYF